MTGNSIISDAAQNTLTWVDGEDSGSVAYLGKAYNLSHDSNPAVTIKELGDDASTVIVEFHLTDAVAPISLYDSNLALGKAEAEKALHAAGLLDFTVQPLGALTGLNEDGTTVDFAVTGANWTVTTGAAWLTASPTSGAGADTVTITVADNAGAARNSTVTFSNGVMTKSFTLAQLINA